VAFHAALAGVFTSTLTQAEDFYGRVLPFDSDTVHFYPDIAATRERRGQPISQIDAQIAAIVRSREARLITRSRLPLVVPAPALVHMEASQATIGHVSFT